MPSLPPFAVTYDYRCPWARNMHEQLIAGLRGGADWDVTFQPFSLNQAHVEEGGTAVWDDPTAGPNLLAGLVSLVVRDEYPDKFLDAHEALFQAREMEKVTKLLNALAGSPDRNVKQFAVDRSRAVAQYLQQQQQALRGVAANAGAPAAGAPRPGAPRPTATR